MTVLQLKKSISLSSLRQPSFRQALSLAAKLGAEGVELNALTDVRPSELTQTGARQIRKWLSDYNLKVAIVHFPTRRGYDDPAELDRRIDGTRQAMKMANDLGCPYVANRIGPIPETDDHPHWSVLTAALHDLANYSFKSGAWLAMRTSTNSSQAMARLLRALPAGGLFIDFDPAELLMASQDPVETMANLGEAVCHFRARDAAKGLSGGPTVEVQLGRGTVDFPALLGALEEHHYRGFITVERNSDEQTIIQCAQGLEYLTNLFA